MISALLHILAAIPAHGQSVDLAHVPAAFCAPPVDVAGQTPNCPANGRFLQAANDCLKSLDRLEAQLGAEAKAIAKSGPESQRGENATGHSEYGFSVASLTYLSGVAAVAKAEIGNYQSFVVPPPSEYDRNEEDPAGDSEGWMYDVPCYRDAQSALGDAAEKLEEKIQRYAARRAEAQAFEAKLATRGTSYESLSGPQATGRAQGSRKPVPQWKSTGGGSDITGVQQDKQKQNQGN